MCIRDRGLADFAADVVVHPIELIQVLGRIGFAAAGVGDRGQQVLVRRHPLALAVEVDIAVLGAVGDRVDRDAGRLGLGGRLHR